MSRRCNIYQLLCFLLVCSLTNCSGDDSFEFSPDPTCGRTISFIVNVSPEGSGSVTKTEYVDSEGLNGLMPFKVVQCYALPQEGYRFLKWDLDPLADREDNPIYFVLCNISTTVKIVRVTAIFERIVE